MAARLWVAQSLLNLIFVGMVLSLWLPTTYIHAPLPRESMASLRLPPSLRFFLCCTKALRRSTEEELVRPPTLSS